MALRVLSFFIIFFPSVDVISAYPLSVLALVNNLFVVVFGKDSAQARKSWAYFIILFLMKFSCALLPIMLAMAVSNLITVLKYTGFTSLFLTLFTPAFLQLTSQWVCRKTFKQALETNYKLKESSSESKDIQPDTGERSLLIRSTSQKKPSALYMTPYSNIFSYWPAVVIFLGMDVVMFALIVASFFFDR